jgi:DNA mismatch repair protein MutS
VSNPEPGAARAGDLEPGGLLDARASDGNLAPSVLFPAGELADDDAPEPSCFADLNLDQVVAGVTAGFNRYQLAPFFYRTLTSIDSVQYRHEVFADLARGALRDVVVDFGRRMQVMRDRVDVMAKLSHPCQRASWFLDAAQIYCDAVRALADGLHRAEPASRALQAFDHYLAGYTAGPAFGSLAEEAETLRRDLGAIRYCIHVKGLRVTVKRHEREADYSPEVLATFEKFQQGAAQGYSAKFREEAAVNHVESQVLDRVALLFPDPFARLDAFEQRHRGFVDLALARFDREVQFYISYCQYLAKAVSVGLPACYPQLSRSKVELVRDAYDLALAARLSVDGTATVCNDFELHDDERILVVSGPNQGGKTTFARTFGQLHHLAALGCPVPGREARLLLTDGVLTHFATEENLAQHTGKLEDDLLRLGDVLQAATGDSVIVLNEIFASTTLDDAVLLGTELMDRIIELDVLCCCVTFIDELSTLEKTVSMMSSVDAAEPARRTYKITRRPADGLAYALAIAEKHGVTYRQLTKRLTAADNR